MADAPSKPLMASGLLGEPILPSPPCNGPLLPQEANVVLGSESQLCLAGDVNMKLNKVGLLCQMGKVASKSGVPSGYNTHGVCMSTHAHTLPQPRHLHEP